MSDPTQQNIPPAWHPDPAGSGRQRWWDGTQWTEHYQEPYASQPVPYTQQYSPATGMRAPDGTSGSTVWIWLIVALIGVGILPMFFIDYGEVIDTSMSSDLPVFTPADVLSYVVSFGSIGLWVLFAVLDYRELSRRGVPRPFHWAWMFFALVTPLVYLIGRSVVVNRRTGSGLAPLWVGVCLTVLSFVVWLVLVAGPAGEAFNEILNDPSLYQ